MKKPLYIRNGCFHKGASARGRGPANQGECKMFKIQIRKNGEMTDYNNCLFATYADAHKARVQQVIENRIWADTRIIAVK
jgi:hypothetical protein